MTAPVRLAVLGDPLRYTLSPVLHRAALRWAGVPGGSEALRTPVADLGARLAALAASGYRGVNLTHPLKRAALDAVAWVSEAARRARAVNTIGFDGGGWGDTTDGPGLVDWLVRLQRAPAAERAAIVGAGGAARSLALALRDAGAEVSLLARDPARAAAEVEGLTGVRVLGLGEAAGTERLARATLVVNATPVSAPDAPLDPARVPAGALALDLVYGPELTPWARAARARGREAHDGVGLLVGQARRSLSAWLGVEVPWEPLEAAVARARVAS